MHLRGYIAGTDYTALNVMRGHSQSLYEVRLWWTSWRLVLCCYSAHWDTENTRL